VLIYNPQLSGKTLDFIAYEAENVMYRLKSSFRPDSTSLNNFRRLSVYEGWLTGKHKDLSGELVTTTGKIPVVITTTQKEMFDISGKQSHAGRFGGFTTFSPVLQNDSVRFVCRLIINYSNPLSVVPLAHEIAHAFSFVVFSRPCIIDSLINVYKPAKIGDMKLELWHSALIRLAGVTVEGLGHWAGWHTTVFYEARILPSVHELLLERTDQLPRVKDLLSGNLDISFWDIIKKIFGSDPTDKIATFFLASASFVDYLIHNSTSEQLFAVFSGGEKKLTANEMEGIYGRRFNELEDGWRSYVKNYKY